MTEKKKQSKLANYTYIIPPMMMAICMPVAVGVLHIPGMTGLLGGGFAGLIIGFGLEALADKMLNK